MHCKLSTFVIPLLCGLLLCCGCSSISTRKPEDVSVWQAVSPVGKISVKMFVADYKALSVKVEEEIRAEEAKKDGIAPEDVKVSGYDIFDKVCDRIEEEPTPGYSPSLTEYFLLMLLIFTVVLVYKAVKAFFISPKKKK